MVSVSLRQNTPGGPDRNTSASTPPLRFTRSIPSENPPLRFAVGYGAWPVRPGDPLEHVEELGYFDWAGRRLFLADGSPDPDTSGAYRYQHSPECCDLEAWDGDPISPRYEPMYLRHRPGDTWLIDADRPHDPDDPGPFGTPGWRPDPRTGRHRRNELPDPLPPSEEELPEPEWTEVRHVPVRRWSDSEVAALHDERDHDEARLPDGRCRANRRRDSAGGMPPESVAFTAPPRTSRARFEPQTSPSEPGGREGGHNLDPKDRNRSRDDDQRGGRSFWTAADEQTGSARLTDPDEPRFSRMREQAFTRFLAKSAELHAAHYDPALPDFRERLLWWWRLALWVLAVGTTPMPRAPWAARGRSGGPVSAARGLVAPGAGHGSEAAAAGYRPPMQRAADSAARQSNPVPAPIPAHAPNPVPAPDPAPVRVPAGQSRPRPVPYAGATGMARALAGAARYRRERANPPRPARIARPGMTMPNAGGSDRATGPSVAWSAIAGAPEARTALWRPTAQVVIP